MSRARSGPVVSLKTAGMRGGSPGVRQLQTSCRVGALGRDSVGEAGDGEVFQTEFGLVGLGLQGVDLGAETVGQGPGGVFLKVECLEEGARSTRRPPVDRAR